MDNQNDKAYYMCKILRTEGENTVLEGEVFDGEKFEFKVPSQRIAPDQLDPTYTWVQVDRLGKNGNRISIVLPTPSTKLGHRISVDITKIRRNMFLQS